MQAPVVVLVEYDFFNGDKDSEVHLFLDIKKAIEYAKGFAKNYLEGNNLTEDDFQSEHDIFEIEEYEDGYSFISWSDTEYNKYNVFAYKGKFEDENLG